MSGALPRRLVLLGLGAALAGCGTSRSPTLYTLVERPGRRIDRTLLPAALRSVEIPKYLDRPEIVRRRTPFELSAAEFERWAEGFDEMTTRVLLEDLSLRLPACPLSISGSRIAPSGGTLISVSLARFDPDPDGTVVLEARWSIDRGRAASSAIRLDRITHPASQETAALVAAMSDCLGTLADHIAEALA